MGVGTSGVATLKVGEGRRFIGIELDECYFEIAKNKIEESLKENLK